MLRYQHSKPYRTCVEEPIQIHIVEHSLGVTKNEESVDRGCGHPRGVSNQTPGKESGTFSFS